MNNIEFLYEYTKDNLRLQGTLWDSDKKDICVVFVHGMCCSSIENYFTTVWGENFVNDNIGFLYGHTRGYSNINSIVDKDGNIITLGTAYEVFEDCIYDIDLWIKKAYELGYKRIILVGHSFGCNKVIYYTYKQKPNLLGLVLASTPDMHGFARKNEKDYDKLLEETKINIEKGLPRKMTSKPVEDYMHMSSEAFYNWYKPNSNVDNIPKERNPKHFEQLETISVPILTFSGSLEEELYLKLELLKEKALNCPSFTTEIVQNANHFYHNCELETYQLINCWINKSK